jgi:hypothetical protein
MPAKIDLRISLCGRFSSASCHPESTGEAASGNDRVPPMIATAMVSSPAGPLRQGSGPLLGHL